MPASVLARSQVVATSTREFTIAFEWTSAPTLDLDAGHTPTVRTASSCALRFEPACGGAQCDGRLVCACCLILS